MTGKIDYTAFDLARHDLSRDSNFSLETSVPGVDDDGNFVDGLTVARVVATTCQVGFGGHYWETLEEDTEGAVLDALANHLGPLYGMTHDEALALLDEVRREFTWRLERARDEVVEAWSDQGWWVEQRAKPSLDECPTCGRRVLDFDETGCEAPDGQRWCVGHALEALAALRPS